MSEPGVGHRIYTRVRQKSTVVGGWSVPSKSLTLARSRRAGCRPGQMGGLWPVGLGAGRGSGLGIGKSNSILRPSLCSLLKGIKTPKEMADSTSAAECRAWNILLSQKARKLSKLNGLMWKEHGSQLEGMPTDLRWEKVSIQNSW